MDGLRWSWLCVPYLVCAAAFTAVGVAAALTRGDRVMRIGIIGAVVTALPWALCQGLAAMAYDPDAARRLLKLGQGPVALVGPNLLLLLLAVGGQLERFRWIARISGIVGAVFVAIAWGTDTVVPHVHMLASGMYYLSPGPLTTIHFTQLVVWLVIGILIVRRSTPRAEQRRTVRLLLGILVLGAVSSIDTMLLYTDHTPWGSYPVAWLPALAASLVALYMIARTNILRPQGVDRAMAIELATFVGAIGAAIVLALFFVDSPLTLAAATSSAWAGLAALAWGIERTRPQQVKEQRALDQFIVRMAKADDGVRIAERLAALWKRTVGIDTRVTRWGDALAMTPELAAWLVEHPQPFAVVELATMRLGAMRAPLEALFKDDPAGMIVPLVDHDEVVALVEAQYPKALRDAERELVVESARAAARAYTFVELAHEAARERETEREVEVADALRLQASSSRDAQLGRWAVAAEYRTAARTTGAGWSATELEDGRLALLVTEAQAHGVAAALATAALTGAFAAATTPGATPITLDELVATMRASSEGVMRGGEPVSAFLAILDAKTMTIEWACAGHAGGFIVGPIAAVDHALADGSLRGVRPKATALGGEQPPGASLTTATRGTSQLPVDSVLVVVSSAVRGSDDAAWRDRLRDSAPVSGRLPTVLVELASRAGDPSEDLLAVVVRAR
ncbi:MAG: SpoIIE family protein phosphatase [Deltaproteobacteria bacterium]